MGNMGVVEWLIILAVVLLIFGGSKLKSLGSDLGSSIKGFKKAVLTPSYGLPYHFQKIEPENFHKILFQLKNH